MMPIRVETTLDITGGVSLAELIESLTALQDAMGSGFVVARSHESSRYDGERTSHKKLVITTMKEK